MTKNADTNFSQDKVDSTLTNEDKNLLFDLSKTLKEFDLCDGYHRKTLFTTARYDSWFISSIPRTCKLLKEVYAETEDSIDEKKRDHLLLVIENLNSGFSTDDDIISYHKFRAGLLDDEELFLFVESFNGTKHTDLAIKIIEKLEARYGTDHDAIKSLRAGFTANQT